MIITDTHTQLISLPLLGAAGIFFSSGMWMSPDLQMPCCRSQEAQAGQQWMWSLQQTACTRHKGTLASTTAGVAAKMCICKWKQKFLKSIARKTELDNPWNTKVIHYCWLEYLHKSKTAKFCTSIIQLVTSVSHVPPRTDSSHSLRWLEGNMLNRQDSCWCHQDIELMRLKKKKGNSQMHNVNKSQEISFGINSFSSSDQL